MQKYADKGVGTYILRGENLVLLGSIDGQIDDKVKMVGVKTAWKGIDFEN